MLNFDLKLTSNEKQGKARIERIGHFKERNSGLVFRQFLKLFPSQFKAHEVAVNEFLLHGAFFKSEEHPL